MATPDFVLALREKVGHDLLWLAGVMAVVLRADREILLVRRADTGEWTPIGGIVEPAEEPAVSARREILEETGVVAEVERLAAVTAGEVSVYPNGDQVAFLTLVFVFRYVSGVEHVADDESTEVGWFALDALPPMRPHFVERIEVAVHGGPRTHFAS